MKVKKQKNKTIDVILAEATEKLSDCHIPQSRAESEILLAYILEEPRWKLYLHKERLLNEETIALFEKALLKRMENNPLSYITEKKEFYGLEFKVSPAVLIPRPETEFLIEALLEVIRESGLSESDKIYIADLGTGSGAIAVTLAKLLPKAVIRALDISDEALVIAKENALSHGVIERVVFKKGRFSDFAKIFSDKFNIIVSNPPYICSDNILTLSPEVRKYEPLKALSGGADGLDCYREIFQAIQKVELAFPATLILETGEDSLEGLKKLCRQEHFIDSGSIRYKKDYRGHERVLIATIN